MTDQTIPADDLRRFIARYRAAVNDQGSILLDELEALLHAPPRPTLADMTPEERHACRWMQADVDGITGRWLILNPYDEDGDVEVVLESGRKEYFSPGRVTTRPDLPRLEWPGDTPTEPDHLAVGTVIESADDPRIDALPVGSILLDRDDEATMKRPWEWEGEGYIPIPEEGGKFAPWTVLHIPKEADQ